MTSENLFSLGLTYWPQSVGFGWWQSFDGGAVREELAHVAGLGCDTLRFCLTWEDFQPGVQRINSGAFNAFEQALEVAHGAGLRVVAALFPVAMSGALWLPEWANGADPIDELRRAARPGGPGLRAPAAGGLPLLYEGGYHANKATDLLADAKALAGQRYLIRELVGYFGSHPALAAWQLGEGLERVQPPASDTAAYDWLATIAEAIREQRPGAQLLGMVSARALATGVGARPEQVAATCDWLGVVADPPEVRAGERVNHGARIAFLHALTAALAERPALIAGIGLATVAGGQPGANDREDQPGWIDDSAYGQPLPVYRADREQQAALIETALDRLQRAGATGAWLPAYADYPAALWRRPPLDRAIRERTLGLIGADGREKPAAAAVRRFAAERRPVLASAPPIEVDPERYWRAPAREFARLWREFTTD